MTQDHTTVEIIDWLDKYSQFLEYQYERFLKREKETELYNKLLECKQTRDDLIIKYKKEMIRCH